MLAKGEKLKTVGVYTSITTKETVISRWKYKKVKDLRKSHLAMQIKWNSLFGLVLLTCFALLSLHVHHTSGNNIFTNSFLVRFRRNVDTITAHSIASRYGFTNLGEVSKHLATYLLWRIFLSLFHWATSICLWVGVIKSLKT